MCVDVCVSMHAVVTKPRTILDSSIFNKHIKYEHIDVGIYQETLSEQFMYTLNLMAHAPKKDYLGGNEESM